MLLPLGQRWLDYHTPAGGSGSGASESLSSVTVVFRILARRGRAYSLQFDYRAQMRAAKGGGQCAPLFFCV
jgi:hypothetical protein